MITIDLGSNKNNPADDLVSISVRPGDTVVVKNHANSADTINYHSRGHSGGATGTVTASNSTTLAGSGTHYISSNSHSTVQISGGLY